MKRNRLIIISSIFMFIMILFITMGLINRNKCLYSFDEVEIKAGEYEKVLYDNISLNPGIYRIDTKYCCETNQSDMYIAFYTPRDNSIGNNKLRSTGGYLYLNKFEDSQEFYLYEKTDDLYIELNSYYDNFSIESIKIFNTGKLWFCATLIALVVYAIALLGIYLIERIRDKSISKEELIRIVSFTGIWIITSLPYLCGNTVLTADGPYHMERVEGVANAIRAGIIPVRIEPTWLQGYGYADGLFYCDLFLVFPALLRIIGFSVTASYNAYLLLVNALVIVVSDYAFRKLIKNEYIALLMTTMYSLSEIKYYQYVYKGTLGEGTALIFLPLVLVGLYGILYEKDKYKNVWVNLALGYIGLISSHTLSTEITLFVTLFIVLLNIDKLFKRGEIIDLFKSVGLTLLATAWFTVPFIESYIYEDVNIKHSFSRSIQSEGLSPIQLAINFFGRKSNEGLLSGIEPVGLGVPLLLALIAFICIISYMTIKKKKTESISTRYFLTSCIIAIVLIVFSLKLFPWDTIQSSSKYLAPLISSIQFPRRFLEWGTLLSIVVLGGVLKILLDSKLTIVARALIVLTIAGIIFSFVSRMDYNVATVLKYPLGNFDGIRTDYVAGGEYVLYGTDLGQLQYSKIYASDGIIYTDYASDHLAGSLKVENASNQEGYIDLPLLNYRHYIATAETGKRLAVANGYNNVVRVLVPSGFSGILSVKYTPPVYWRICEIISIISGIVFVLYMLKDKLIKAESHKKKERTEN